jgi:hypothetical protein
MKKFVSVSAVLLIALAMTGDVCHAVPRVVLAELFDGGS